MKIVNVRKIVIISALFGVLFGLRYVQSDWAIVPMIICGYFIWGQARPSRQPWRPR